MNHWLVKSEASKYSWQMLLKDGKTFWDGVRNYQARNNLKAMKKGDLVLFYHSVDEKEVVGIAKVVKEFYQDPTTTDAAWVVVDIAPYQTLKHPVTLETIKADTLLQHIALIQQARLSVMPLKSEEFNRIIELSEK